MKPGTFIACSTFLAALVGALFGGLGGDPVDAMIDACLMAVIVFLFVFGTLRIRKSLEARGLGGLFADKLGLCVAGASIAMIFIAVFWRPSVFVDLMFLEVFGVAILCFWLFCVWLARKLRARSA